MTGQEVEDYIKRLNEEQPRKHGGRTKKMDGGPMSQDPRAKAAAMLQAANAMGAVPQDRMQFGGIKKGLLRQAAGVKKGGKVDKDHKFAWEKESGLKKGGKVSHMEWKFALCPFAPDKPVGVI
jgi:hypothetical protein